MLKHTTSTRLTDEQCHESWDKALEAAEKTFHTTGQEVEVHTWNVHPNLPGALPKEVENVCRMALVDDRGVTHVSLY
jgi:hypothetical protein